MENDWRSELISYYGIKTFDSDKKRKMNQQIKRILARAFPDQTWEELSDIEKQWFKLVEVKKYLLDRIETESARKRIEKKIEKESKAAWIEVQN